MFVHALICLVLSAVAIWPDLITAPYDFIRWIAEAVPTDVR